MISTQARENIVISVDPSVTAKAATLAAQAGNKTTANVIEEWLAAHFSADPSTSSPAPATPAQPKRKTSAA